MADFVSLEKSLRRAMVLSAAVCAVLLAVTIASLAAALRLAWSVRAASAALPVVVVPGAIAGTYTPGLSEDSVRNTARYLVGLGTSFGGLAAMDQRFDELESIASAQFLPKLQAARASLRRDVEAQGQARVFFASAGGERFRQPAPGHFEFSQEGERRVFASGLPMDQRRSLVRLSLVIATPSQRSPFGLAIDGFEVVDLDGASPSRHR